MEIYKLPFQKLPLDSLVVNKDNDRHGHTETEEKAIAWLFERHGPQMLSLAKDIVENGRLFDAPLVKHVDGKYVVYDGNRRITCLKLLNDPSCSPAKYRTNFKKLSEVFSAKADPSVECQIEVDQQQIDLALNRRHGGTDGGKGQLKWDTRAKANHVNRTGGTNQYPIAEAIEHFLEEEGYPDANKIGRSTLNRLMQTKKRRSRFGVELGENRGLVLTRPKEDVLRLLAQVADDILGKKLTLKNW